VKLGPPWGAEERDRQQPDQAAKAGQDDPVEQSGDGAHVLLVSEQAHPGLEVARWMRVAMRSSWRGVRRSSRARLALAHSAAICSAASMTR
jgi:hypothetical protein